MQLVIIAGGKGTRLGLKDIPKPMVEIDGKPLLEHQINLAKRYGIKDIFILSGHLAEVIVDYFKDGSDLGVNITHIIEPYPLGTAGSLKLIEKQLNERFMVFYGDIVMDFDLDRFIEFDKKYNSIGTTLIHPNDHPYDSDLVDIDNHNRVTEFISKPHDPDKYYRNLVNAAVYIFSPEIFKYIEPDKSQDFGKHILPKVVQQNEILMGYSTPEYIKDMGTGDRLEKVKQDFISQKVARLNFKNKRKAVFIDRDGTINPDLGDNQNINEFKLFDGVSEAVKKLNKSEFLSIVITNQPAIAKGFVTKEELNEIHKKMETLLGNENAYLNGIYYCPHHPDKGFEGEIPELKINCDCRKPKTGMIFQAAKDFNIKLEDSYIIGDTFRDMQAGKKAGLTTILVNSKNKCEQADFIFDNMLEAVNFVLENKKVEI
jgi:D,D-heptose 1,7-bisphosphate phosphatase